MKVRHDATGSAVTEFALIAPIFLTLLMGAFDMGYNMWAMTILQGSLQEAARLSTIEGASSNLTSLDAIVTKSIKKLVPNATLVFTHKSYTNFTDIGVPEDWTDINGNGTCDAGEPYEDANANGSWDRDRGTTGGGGARDAVLYEVTVTYPRAFPMTRLVGLSSKVTTSASTVLRNQPYKLQGASTKVGNCA
jgi:Flp pilus assembly protein TadG